MKSPQIILASTSIRRQELMSSLRISFKVVSSGYEEDMTLKMTPFELAKYLSIGKAKATATLHPRSIVIAADTFVVFNKAVIGKPKSKIEAIKMLKWFSGKNVKIITGLAIIDTAQNKVFSEIGIGTVKFKKISSSEINNYIKSGEPMDKAGAFAVQGLGGVLIEKVSGDFNSIIGLPLFKVAKILTKLGVKIL